MSYLDLLSLSKRYWATAFRRDPKGTQGRILPVRIERCEVEGLLALIVYIDLVDLR